MLKILLLFTLVICSQSILLSKGNDDEFAEFDDFNPGENIRQSDNLEPVVDKYSQKQSSPDAISSQSDSKSKSEPTDFEYKNDAIGGKKRKDGLEGEEKVKTQKKPDLKLVNAPAPRFDWEHYYIEIAFLSASFLYFVNYFLGSSKNHSLAKQWYENSKDTLKNQFVLVGGAPQHNDGNQKKDDDSDQSMTTSKKQKGLIKTSESNYTLWSSGRIGMDGCLVEINLLKRQDLFSMALNLLRPTSDTLVLRFLLNQDGYENFVFCLAHKSLAPKLARDMVDINMFCSKKKPISQYGVESEKIYVMSELGDVVSFILESKTVNFIKKYEKAIKYIHITDQYSTVRQTDDIQPAQKLINSKRMAIFSFTFPETASERADYFMFALSLLDRLRKYKLIKDNKQKSEKNRQKIADILQKITSSRRQEAAQNKKDEQRRLEKERIYEEDDPEKQRRWEKKEAKREQKKNKMRVKQLKMKV